MHTRDALVSVVVVVYSGRILCVRECVCECVCVNVCVCVSEGMYVCVHTAGLNTCMWTVSV